MDAGRIIHADFGDIWVSILGAQRFYAGGAGAANTSRRSQSCHTHAYCY